MYDLLLINGRIYTLEEEGEKFCAMAVRNGRIAALLKDNPSQPKEMARRVIDLDGKTVIPGLIDSHMHFMATAALQYMALKVSEVDGNRLVPTCIEDVGQKIQAFIKNKDKKLPIMCYNYVVASIMEDRLPNRQELDRWAPGRAVMVLSMDGHSSSYSSKALGKMGISSEKNDGILTGAEHEFNMGKLNAMLMESLNLPMLISGVQQLVNEALSFGIVGLHCLEGFEDAKNDASLKFFMRFAGVLPVHIRVYVQYKDVKRVLPFVSRMRKPRIGGCGSWEMDGSIGSRSAAFKESYLDDSTNFGQCYYTPEEAEKMVREAENAGLQIASHAIGTAGIQTLFSAYETAGIDRASRHRVEHLEFPTLEQVEQAVDKLKLVITAQPGYSWIDDKFQKAYKKYLRPEQYERQIPLKTIVEKGGILCGSSDAPVQSLNPFLQMHGMVNYVLKDQALTVYQALRAYTYNGAYATFEEKDRGTLANGKLADFVILNQDPFEINKEEMINVKALNTYIEGKSVKKMNMGTLEFLAKGLFTSKKI